VIVEGQGGGGGAGQEGEYFLFGKEGEVVVEVGGVGGEEGEEALLDEMLLLLFGEVVWEDEDSLGVRRRRKRGIE